MKTIAFAAALLLASTAAQAGSGISFQIDGQKIRIDAPKNCSSLDCIKITGVNGSKLNLSGFGAKKDDADVAPAPTAPAPVAAAAVAPAPAPAAAPAPSAIPAPVTYAPPAPPALPAPLPPAPAPAAAAPAPVVAAPAPVAATPAPAANSPLGVWATEDNKGNVRVESCGANLCGYAVNTGERILINMKPDASKWVGRIHDPDSGRDYDSTIAMRGPNILKVQGCAFGGLFCGGQSWKRVS